MCESRTGVRRLVFSSATVATHLQNQLPHIDINTTYFFSCTQSTIWLEWLLQHKVNWNQVHHKCPPNSLGSSVLSGTLGMVHQVTITNYQSNVLSSQGFLTVFKNKGKRKSATWADLYHTSKPWHHMLLLPSGDLLSSGVILSPSFLPATGSV